jgi:hypothetical protein
MMKPILTTLFITACLVSTLAQDAPEKLVQKQLEAYNRGDLKAFVSTYADSVEIYGFNNQQLLMKGKALLEKEYGELFKMYPKNYAALRGRIVQGNFVIDKEHVTGRGEGQEMEATAIYEVKNGLIVKVWFIW